MADIKRPNYFTSQFLVEKDFNDEQAYHVNMRRRHNRVLHASGVADGLLVTRFSTTQVTVSSGTAVDKDGREIALEDARTYTLSTVGNDLDVYLTIAYGEFLDPADKDTQAGLEKFFRTTERPLLQDGTAVPPADGSVIVLARIHLSASGTIESDGSIDSSVRSLAGAKLTPASVGTDQLTDGAVTLKKLANEALPLAIQAANAITVVTDTVAKRVTVGENHSARTDNPHTTTAQQIDSQGGTNRIVTQINAGTGIIAKARVEPDTITGVVVFSNLVPGTPTLPLEQSSNDVDPGLGAGPLTVQLAIDDLAAASVTTASDTGYARAVLMRSEVNRNTGRFRIVVSRTGGTAGPLRVRWTAFRVPTVPDVTVDVSVSISPPAPLLAGSSTQVLTATVNNGTQGVTWAGPFGPNPGNGNGSLTNLTSTSATYTSPINTGTYTVKATSLADPTKSQTISIGVTGDITVILSQLTASLVVGQQVTITGDVINTTNKGITWSTSGGTISATSGPSTTFTAPAATGQYVVTATSADQNKTSQCVITVVPVTIAIFADDNPIGINRTTTLRSTITPAFANQNVTWTAQGLGGVTAGPSTTATFSAPSTGSATTTITGRSVADPTRTRTLDITTLPTGTGPGPGGPGPGKVQGPNGVPIEVPFAPPPPEAEGDPVVQGGLPEASFSAAADIASTAKAATTADASKTKPRAFVTPKKRVSPKVPPEPSDE
jgi:hypothetical protein